MALTIRPGEGGDDVTAARDLTGAQAARMLGISRQRVHQLAVAGDLASYRDPKGRRRFPRYCIEQFQARRAAAA
jgi:excisionase family DNA binding protein